jgi:hypothetical protein
MRWLGASIALAVLLPVREARAAEPDPGLALFSGAAVNLAGFVVGGTLLATSHGRGAQNSAGWLTMESAFTVSPLVAHGVVDEWWRGAAFAALPAATLATTAGIFADDPTAVERGGLPEQRWMWALFGVGLFASAAGIVDAMFAPARALPVRVAPAIGAGQVGLRIGGTL